MLLTFDIGNTQISLGLFDHPSDTPHQDLRCFGRLPTDANLTVDEYVNLVQGILEKNGLSSQKITHVALASVVPVLDAVFQKMIYQLIQKDPFWVTANSLPKGYIQYNNPLDVGADRLANAAAAHAMIEGPCLVVDFGTATTFDCISGEGHYLGGVIALGPTMAAEALAQKTAKLPLVSKWHKPEKVIGQSTSESLLSGTYFGYLGLIERTLSEIKQEMGPAQVLATGGMAKDMSRILPVFDQVIPDLTLQGIRLLWCNNHSKGKLYE